MKFRQHRGGFADSMSTVFEFDNKEALLSHINEGCHVRSTTPPITDLTFKHVGFDERNGWDTYYVIGILHGESVVLGMSDGTFEQMIHKGTPLADRDPKQVNTALRMNAALKRERKWGKL